MIDLETRIRDAAPPMADDPERRDAIRAAVVARVGVPGPNPRRRRRWELAIAFAVLALLAVAVAIVISRRPAVNPPPPAPAHHSTTPAIVVHGSGPVSLMLADGGDGKVWSIAADGHVETRDLLSGDRGGRLAGLDWSPDGSKLALAIWDDTPEGGLWIGDDHGMGGNGPCDPACGIREPDWSPDGTRILVAADTGVDLVRVSATILDILGSRKVVVGPASSPTWSPDGKRFAYARAWTPDAGRPHPSVGAIVIRNLTTGHERVAVAHGSAPAWSPDGRTIAYIDASGCGLGILDVPSGSSGTVFRDPGICRIGAAAIDFAKLLHNGAPAHIVWSPAGNELLVGALVYDIDKGLVGAFPGHDWTGVGWRPA
jgi:hypothetical protein